MKPVIMQPCSGKLMHAFGQKAYLMLSGDQTNDSVTIISEITPPGGGSPYHVHSLEDEIFLVTKGQMEYYIEGKWIEVGVGGLLFLPKGIAHCFRNVGKSNSCHWIIVIPSGFENFYEKCAEEFSKTDHPDQGRINEIHEKFGISILELTNVTDIL